MSTDFIGQTQRLVVRDLLAKLAPHTRHAVEDCARDIRWLIARNEAAGRLALLLVASEGCG